MMFCRRISQGRVLLTNSRVRRVVTKSASKESSRSVLERIWRTTPTVATPEMLRMAMYKRLNRVHDIDLMSHNGEHSIVVYPDTSVPEKKTMEYMKKLGDIVDALNSWGVSRMVLDAFDEIPRDVNHWQDDGGHRVALGYLLIRPMPPCDQDDTT